MANNPIIGGPVTDFFFIMAHRHKGTFQNPICDKIERKFVDCLEAYGMKKATTMCAEIMYDVVECSTSVTQKLRMKAIQKERMKKFREGKLAKPFEEHPPLDSYLSI